MSGDRSHLVRQRSEPSRFLQNNPIGPRSTNRIHHRYRLTRDDRISNNYTQRNKENNKNLCRREQKSHKI